MIFDRIPLDERFDLCINEHFRSFASDLFFRADYHELHRKHYSHSYRIQFVDRHRKESYGEIWINSTDGNHFRSPFRGSYGGFKFDPTISLRTRDGFVARFFEWFESQGYQSLQIILAPEIYDFEGGALQNNTLFRLGCQLERVELNYSIEVDQTAFETRLDRSNRKRLERGTAQNLSFAEFPTGQAQTAYDIIAENRAKNGFPMTMSWPDLQLMFETFPGLVKAHGVFKDGQPIAASITMRVCSHVLYVFYWGDKAGVESISPVTFLASHLYKICQTEKVRVLDLGTSTVNSEPNYGLIQYKENLGSVTSGKMVWKRTFA